MNKKGLVISNFIIAFCLSASVLLGVLVNKNTPSLNVETDVFKEKILNDLNNLTLEEKIAQMLIISFDETSFTDRLKEELETNKVGGVIIFKENITNYEDTLNLIQNTEKTADIPMFIATDQEGGKVQRFQDILGVNMTNIPSMWELGKTNNPTLAYDVGKVIAEELAAFHINMNFAPVLDIVADENSQFIGSRSFGSNAAIVTKMANALAQGLVDNDVIPVFKHFPGHGSTITDSHYELPVIEKSLDELSEEELIPFINAIDAGADVIMIGHLATPNITLNSTPASLSKEIVTDLLKQKLGYDGLVITDALNMKAITNYYTEQEIYEMAINAGVDILLMPNSSTSAINLIKDSIDKGTITIEQINNSVSKILELKYKLNNNYPSKDIIGNAEHKEIIAKIK